MTPTYGRADSVTFPEVAYLLLLTVGQAYHMHPAPRRDETPLIVGCEHGVQLPWDETIAVKVAHTAVTDSLAVTKYANQFDWLFSRCGPT